MFCTGNRREAIRIRFDYETIAITVKLVTSPPLFFLSPPFVRPIRCFVDVDAFLFFSSFFFFFTQSDVTRRRLCCWFQHDDTTETALKEQNTTEGEWGRRKKG